MIPFIIILLILLYIIETRSVETALDGIEFTYSLSKALLEPCEEFWLISTITNKSGRFVPFLRIEEFIPSPSLILSEGLKFKEDMTGNFINEYSLYLMPKSKVVRKIRLSIKDRGRYVFRGAQLFGGDFLGLSENHRNFPSFNEVVVYPKEVRIPEIETVLGGLLGDISVRRFMMEDPILTVGAREYSGKEPMKNISWRHTARTGNIMVKQFDYTTEPVISVVMDVETDGMEGAYDIIERVYSLSRTVCQALYEKGLKYDFLTNATTGDGFARWSYVNEGKGFRHFSIILEGLGRASYQRVEKFSQIVEMADRGHGVIIISTANDEYRKSNISYLEKKTGVAVRAIYAAKDEG